MYSRVTACQVATYYYVGFAYLMMRRYQDAIRSFTNILLYIQRTSRMMPPGSYQVDLVSTRPTSQTTRVISVSTARLGSGIEPTPRPGSAAFKGMYGLFKSVGKTLVTPCTHYSRLF